MDAYLNTLKDIIIILAKTYAAEIIILAVLLGLCFLVRKRKNVKKASMLLVVLIAITFLRAGITIVPRLVDLNQSSFVTINNGKLVVDETNTVNRYSSSILVHGYADVIAEDGKSIKLTGINFFELSSDPYEEYHGDIIYAKHSRQIIAIKK